MDLQEQSERIDGIRQEIAVLENDFRNAQDAENTAQNTLDGKHATLYLRYRTEGKGIDDSKQWAILGTQEERSTLRIQEGLRRASYTAMENRRKALGAIEALLYARNSEIKMEMSHAGQ